MDGPPKGVRDLDGGGVFLPVLPLRIGEPDIYNTNETEYVKIHKYTTENIIHLRKIVV